MCVKLAVFKQANSKVIGKSSEVLILQKMQRVWGGLHLGARAHTNKQARMFTHTHTCMHAHTHTFRAPPQYTPTTRPAAWQPELTFSEKIFLASNSPM